MANAVRYGIAYDGPNAAPWPVLYAIPLGSSWPVGLATMGETCQAPSELWGSCKLRPYTTALFAPYDTSKGAPSDASNGSICAGVCVVVRDSARGALGHQGRSKRCNACDYLSLSKTALETPTGRQEGFWTDLAGASPVPHIAFYTPPHIQSREAVTRLRDTRCSGGETVEGTEASAA
jgi:hypothetical protein